MGTRLQIDHMRGPHGEKMTSVCFAEIVKSNRLQKRARERTRRRQLHQEVWQYFLVRDGAGLKLLPVNKLKEQFHERQSNQIQRADELHHLAILLLNLLYKFH